MVQKESGDYMAIREIAKMGNPILYKRAQTIANPTDLKIKQLAEDMKDTLIHVGGSGIAAPQVYESLRLVVYRLSSRLIKNVEEEVDPWVVLVNPVLTPINDKKILGWERCLSIPGMHGKVSRHESITMTYQDLDGSEFSINADGAFAALLQHECDHLDGILYPMQMTDLSKLEFNSDPGHLANDIASGKTVWPVLQKLVDTWPSREKWFSD